MEENALFRWIGTNDQLTFVDPYDGSEIGIKELLRIPLPTNEKGLAFLYLDNSRKSIGILLAFLQTKWTIALLNPALDNDYKTKIEEDYLPGYIIDASRNVIKGYQIDGTGFFKRLMSGDFPIDGAIKLLLTTSGSTGSPKFVKLSEENLIENTRSILGYLPIAKSDTVPLNLPVFYSYGLSVLLTNVVAGGRIICTREGIMEKGFWEQWKRYRFSSIAGVPYSYEVLLRLGFTTKELPGLRYLTQAGGKLHRNALEKITAFSQERQIPFYVMYGQTEATARMAFLDPERLLDKTGAIGKPIANGEFKLVDGELVYQGRNVFGGYASSWKDLEKYDKQEELYTGDMAKMDADGFYYITGRKKRFAKLFGNRINLDEVEGIIGTAFPGIRNACFHSEDKWIDILVEGDEKDRERLRDFLAEKLKLPKRIIRVYIVEKIPVNANGKTNYQVAGTMIDREGFGKLRSINS